MYTLKSFANGFKYIEIQTKTASAKIALQGAHIFEYSRKNKSPILWLSKESDFEIGKAIRGGIPLCWPRFGNADKQLPQHGFARTAMFEFVHFKELTQERVEILFSLKDSEQSRKIWNYSFDLQITFIIGESLTIQMKTKNISCESFMLTQAFHSYFDITNITNVSIKNLDATKYLDTLTNELCTQVGEVHFHSEVDRVYKTGNALVLQDKEKNIHIKSKGSHSVVVWNPWIDKCAQMSAMSEHAYKEFVCIENANAFEDVICIDAGTSHTLEVQIKVQHR